MTKRMIHFGIVLGLVCAAAALGVAGTYRLTRQRIEQRKVDKQDAFLALLFQAAGAEPRGIVRGSGESGVYRGEADGKTIAYAALGSGQGYSSRVKVFAATDVACTKILAIIVTNQSETPGLGTQIEDVKPDASWADVVMGKRNPVEAVAAKYRPPKDITSLAEFQQQFSETWRKEKGREPLSVGSVALGKGVDGITGATISSRAVVTAVNEAVSRIRAVIKAETP